MDENIENKVKYRLLVGQGHVGDDLYWTNKVWEGERIYDSELKEKYTYWTVQQGMGQYMMIDLPHDPDLDPSVVSVDVQVGILDKSKNEYFWENTDYLGFLKNSKSEVIRE
jgi:hypothetical protein